ncbi:hypothetical protein CDAR_577611 [Caerostris darwini]|uniref:Uncharacterized protein n=1 Tax=Caerostris darwini TaxID=1538125 RepID=A0AAV4URS4_9ARAC|nr:hypothetical protein CDAR_577611 [Caerostris darwini]
MMGNSSRLFWDRKRISFLCPRGSRVRVEWILITPASVVCYETICHYPVIRKINSSTIGRRARIWIEVDASESLTLRVKIVASRMKNMYAYSVVNNIQRGTVTVPQRLLSSISNP